MLRDIIGMFTGETQKKFALSVVVAALGGITLGGILGLLFAPRSGKRTREKIADEAEDVADEAKKKTKKLGRRIKA